jgi:hypothetical protein
MPTRHPRHSGGGSQGPPAATSRSSTARSANIRQRYARFHSTTPAYCGHHAEFAEFIASPWIKPINFDPEREKARGVDGMRVGLARSGPADRRVDR